MTPDDVRAYLCVQGLKNRYLVDAGFFYICISAVCDFYFIYKCRFFCVFSVQYFRPSEVYMGESFQ